MELKYNEPKYFGALFNKICEMPIGESPVLEHKNDEEKEKFDNHIKHFISYNSFDVFNFYIVYNSDYTRIIKKEYPYNQMEYLEKLEKEKIK